MNHVFGSRGTLPARPREAGPQRRLTAVYLVLVTLVLCLVTGPLFAQSASESNESGRQRLGELPAVFVKKIRLDGNTVFTELQLRQRVLARYENRLLSAEMLQQLRRELTRLYVDNGYINSGALIPDQQVRAGVLAIRITEGTLSTIVVPDDASATVLYWRQRLQATLPPVLNTVYLTEQLGLLQAHPAIRLIDARLNPGAALGQARLQLNIEEMPPWQWRVLMANDRSPGIGAERVELAALKRSLSGRADPLELRIGRTRGQTDGSVQYSRPLGLTDWTLSTRAERSFSTVVEVPFDQLDIDSRLDKASLSVARKLVRRAGLHASIELGVASKWGRTSLLGEPFTFANGSQNGRSRSRTFSVDYDLLSQTARSALAIRTGVSVGRNGLKTQIDPVLGPIAPFYPTSFVVWRGQLRYARRVGSTGGRLVARLDAQFTDDALVQIERLAIGGTDSVRGYRENQVTRDRGVVLSAQYSHPIGRTDLGGRLRAGDATITGTVFADYGFGSNLLDPITGGHWLGSVGLGVRMQTPAGWHTQISYGYRLNKDHRRGSDLQDRGWHWSIGWQTE